MSVFLGIIEDGDRADETAIPRLEDAPWTENKIGGSPIFITSNTNVIDKLFDQLRCKNCSQPCHLILQLSSPVDDSEDDRVLQIYTCLNDQCQKHYWYCVRCLFTPPAVRPGQELVIKSDRRRFEAHYITVIDEPDVNENFARDNMKALRMAANYRDADAPEPGKAINKGSKNKDVKNYQRPQSAASTNLEEYEQFQLEHLYSNDKVLYRFHKRLSRYPSQIIRYEFGGEPLLNSSNVKLSPKKCPLCGAKRSFELQLMPALINYLKVASNPSTSVDQSKDCDLIDFGSIIIHTCSANCKTSFCMEDCFVLPDPDSQLIDKFEKRAANLREQAANQKKPTNLQEKSQSQSSKKSRKKKKKKGNPTQGPSTSTQDD